MNSVAQVCIHASQFPENVRRDLITSLRTRRVNHKFHYDSVKQTQKWLALHEAHSPARYDQQVLATYEEAFVEAAKRIKSRQAHLIGLGCGGGQKDAQLIKRLRSAGKEVFYTPCDVSTAMVLVAQQTTQSLIQSDRCFPFVCDLATVNDLSAVLPGPSNKKVARLITFFGMIPNFEPGQILPKLGALMGKNDLLLFSANLAPGNDYANGMKQILPQYDNELTRDWLSAFLFDLGVLPDAGRLRFDIETGGAGLKRFVCRFDFKRLSKIKVSGVDFTFKRGESIRLFYSYRYTPDRAVKLLARHKLRVCEKWVAPSGEEGIFLCGRQ